LRIYEINARVHSSSFEGVTDAQLAELRSLGFDAIWMMGVWKISDGARNLSKITAADFEGSPYAVPEYELNRELGGRPKFLNLVKRAHSAGLRVIVDFVSNHMALDSPWIIRQPDLFVRSDSAARTQSTNEFFLHRSGEVIAFGRDPYFPPWTDTAQLDYSSGKLRNRMIDVLKRISTYADGVRCDMAMLILRECFRKLWYPLVSDSQFDQMMVGEFWAEAIEEVKKSNPDFKFIAEAYWDKETELRQLGFDLCYEKKLYDALVNHDFGRMVERIHRDAAELQGSLYFIENHDEPRAATVFSPPEQLSALALLLSIPGSVLIHEGQMEGKHEKLPVQRIKPLSDEPPDLALRESYARLLRATDDVVFTEGTFELFDPQVYGALAFTRRLESRVVGYIGQITDGWHKFNGPAMNLSAVARQAGARGQLRLRNLLSETTSTVTGSNGDFRVEMSRLGVDEASRFCLFEAFAD